jgi:hypothetical protein
MHCVRCDSGNQVEFPSEIAIHFSGRENLDKPHVFVFPKILVCLNCGFSGFVVSEKDLGLLREGIKSFDLAEVLPFALLYAPEVSSFSDSYSFCSLLTIADELCDQDTIKIGP